VPIPEGAERATLTLTLSQRERGSRCLTSGEAGRGRVRARAPGILVLALAMVLPVVLPMVVSCRPGLSDDPVARGGRLAAELGCAVCHTASGAQANGPTFKGMFGRQVALADGRTVVADEAYLATRLTDPGATPVAGYDPAPMAAALELARTTLERRENVEALVAYIRSLG
jgi:hypothetical protein